MKIKKIFTSIFIYLYSATPVFARITNPAIPEELGDTDDYGGGLAAILANVWKSAMIMGSLAFVLYFAWGALRWMTAEGDKGKFEEGRNKMANGAIGLIILAASQAIIQLVGSIFNISFLESLSFEFPTFPTD